MLSQRIKLHYLWKYPLQPPIIPCLSHPDSHFTSYPPATGGAKTASTRFHPCIPGPWLAPNKCCLHKGVNNQINYSWISPLWPHQDVPYPILTFSPSVSAHPAHYFFTLTQPLPSFLTNTPQVLCTCPRTLLSKTLTLDHFYSLSLHPWLRAGKQNDTPLHHLCVGIDSLLSFYHSCFLFYLENRDTCPQSWGQLWASPFNSTQTLSSPLLSSRGWLPLVSNQASLPASKSPCDLISTFPFSSPFFLCLLL